MHDHCHQRLVVHRTNQRKSMTSARRKRFKDYIKDAIAIYLLIPERSNPERTVRETGKVQIAAASARLNVRTAAVKDNPPEENSSVVGKKRQPQRTCRRPQAA